MLWGSHAAMSCYLATYLSSMGFGLTDQSRAWCRYLSGLWPIHNHLSAAGMGLDCSIWILLQLLALLRSFNDRFHYPCSF